MEFTKVSSFADLAKLEAEKEAVVKMVEDILAKIRSTSAAENKLSVAVSSKELISSAREAQAAQAEMTKSVKTYEAALKSQQATEKSAAQVRKELTAATKNEAAAKKELALAAKAEAQALKEGNAARKIAAQADKEAALAKLTLAKVEKETALASLANAKTTTENAKAKDIETKMTIALTREKERLEKAADRERKQAEKLNNAYEQLKAKYTLAANTAKQLGAAEGSNSANFKEAAAAAGIYYRELVKIEDAVGQSQRKVGQYENATFALSQTFRELPAFANSIQTGLSGISNNLPMVVDGFKALRAQGLSTGAAFKVMASSLFSWANIATLAVSLALFFADDLKKLFGASRDMVEVNKDLAESSGKVVDAITEEAASYRTLYAERLRLLKAQQQVAAAGGIQEAKNFALRKKIAAEEKSQAESEAKFLAGELTGKVILDKQNALTTLGALQRNYQEDVAQSLIGLQRDQAEYSKAVALQDEDEIERLKKKLELRSAEVSAARAGLQSTTSALESVNTADTDAATLAAEEMKFNADERRRLILESARIEVELQKEKNGKILSDERSTMVEQVGALKNNLAQRRRIIEAEKTAVLSDPTSSNVDRTLAIKKAKADEIAAEIQSQTDILKVKEEWRFRNLEANKAAKLRELELSETINRALSKGEELELGLRLEALKKATEDRKAIIDEEYKFKLQKAGLSAQQIKDLDAGADPFTIKNIKVSNAELLNLMKEHENEVLQLSINTDTATTEVLKTELDKQKGLFNEQAKFIELFYKRIETSGNQQYAEDVINLNKAFTSGKISYERYLKDRAKLDLAYQKQSTANGIQLIQDQLKAYSGAENAQNAAAARLAKLREQYAKASTDVEKKAILEKIALADDDLKDAKDKVAQKIELENKLAKATIAASDESSAAQKKNAADVAKATETLRGEYLNLIEAVGTGTYEREKNEVQGLIDELEKKKQKDIEVANASSATTEQKAAQIKIIESRAAAQKEQLEKRQRAIDAERAKFEKAMNIARIIYQTAVGVSNALSGPPPAPPNPILAGVIAATGAVQLAKVISQPIPRYKEGTENHPGGPAIVGDGGVSEVVKEPGRPAFLTPDRPTLINRLAKGAKVFPSVEEGAAALLAGSLDQNVAGGPSEEALALSRMVDTLKAEGKKTRAAIQNKRETILSINQGGVSLKTREGYNETTYLNRNLHF